MANHAYNAVRSYDRYCPVRIANAVDTICIILRHPMKAHLGELFDAAWNIRRFEPILQRMHNNHFDCAGRVFTDYVTAESVQCGA